MSINWEECDYSGYEWVKEKPKELFKLDTDFDGDKLRLSGPSIHEGLSNYQEKKIKDSWVEILPQLDSVEMLWVAPKINQKLFDAICTMPNLKGLWIKHSSITEINFKELSGLSYFNLGSSTGLNSLEGIEHLVQLKWLEFENIKKISDITEISKLENLKVLGLNGSTWTTQKIDSLQPLITLKELERLSLVNTRVTDKSFKALHNLSLLSTLDVAQWWPDNEVLELQQANPKLLKKWKEWREW